MMPVNKKRHNLLVHLALLCLLAGSTALSGVGIADAAKVETVDQSSISPATGPTIKPRYERSSSKERVIFDFAEPVYHTKRLAGDQLIIWFDRPMAFDLGALQGHGQSRLRGARSAGHGPTRWVALDLRPGSSVQSLVKDDHIVVITIEGDDAGTPVAEGEAPGGKTWSPRKRPSPETGQKTKTETDVADQAPAVPAPTATGRDTTENGALPGQFDVDEDALDRALERTLTRVGALLLPTGMIEIEPSFGYVRRESSAPTQVDLFGLFAQVRETEIRRDEVSAGLAMKLGMPFDSQAEISLPFEHVRQKTTIAAGFTALEDSSSSTTGFGDLSIGLAKSILREKRWWPDIVGRLRWDTDTGRSADGNIGLGGGSHELIGSLSFVKSQDPLAFIGSVSYQKSFENNGFDPGDRIGLAIGTVLAAGPDTSLRLSLSQSFADDSEADGEKIPGSDEISASVNMGASSVLGQGVLLDASVSAGLTEDAPDYAVRFALPIRFKIPRRFYVTMVGDEAEDTSSPME